MVIMQEGHSKQRYIPTEIGLGRHATVKFPDKWPMLDLPLDQRRPPVARTFPAV